MLLARFPAPPRLSLSPCKSPTGTGASRDSLRAIMETYRSTIRSPMTSMDLPPNFETILWSLVFSSRAKARDDQQLKRTEFKVGLESVHLLSNQRKKITIIIFGSRKNQSVWSVSSRVLHIPEELIVGISLGRRSLHPNISTYFVRFRPCGCFNFLIEPEISTASLRRSSNALRSARTIYPFEFWKRNFAPGGRFLGKLMSNK